MLGLKTESTSAITSLQANPPGALDLGYGTKFNHVSNRLKDR